MHGHKDKDWSLVEIIPIVQAVKLCPAENAGSVWAIIGNDSTKVASVKGVFQLNDLKAGTYKIVVEATAPYKEFVKEGVVVRDDEVPDPGNITLSK